MRKFVHEHATQAPVVGAVGMAVLYVGLYVFGQIDRGDALDPLLLVVLACVGVFIGWTLFALVGVRLPDSGADSDAGWSRYDPRRR